MLLLRHAKSSWAAEDEADIDRPLSPRGRRAAKLIGTYLKGRKPALDLVLCSAARRTVETWERLSPSLGETPTVRTEKGLYLASRQSLVSRLARLPEGVRAVLLVGHNPGLEELALLLTSRGRPPARARMAAKYPTACLAWFIVEGAWTELGPDTARLKDFVTPADLGEGEDEG